MCPMLLSRLTDGPSLVLSPPQDHVFFPFPSYPRLDCPSSSSTSTSTSSVDRCGNNTSSFNNGSAFKRDAAFSAPTTTTNPSKKRSCREAGFDAGSMVAPVRFPNQPAAGLTDNSDSGSNTEYSIRKSQRFDTSASALDDDISHASGRRVPHGHSGKRSGLLSSQGPSVDDATTRLLGISWQRIDGDGDVAAAMRGWEKYIDIQYSTYLQDSHILMKNRALNLYLVSAARSSISVASSPLSFYLFSEDLTQAQLVGSTWETTVQNLRSVPIAFEGTEVLRAGAVSGPADKSPDQQKQDHGNGGSAMVQSVSCGGMGSDGDMGMGMGMDIDM